MQTLLCNCDGFRPSYSVVELIKIVSKESKTLLTNANIYSGFLIFCLFVWVSFATETHTLCNRGGKKATKEDPKGGEGQPRAADGNRDPPRGDTNAATLHQEPGCVTARPVEPAALLTAFAEHTRNPLAMVTGLLPAAKPAPAFPAEDGKWLLSMERCTDSQKLGKDLQNLIQHHLRHCFSPPLSSAAACCAWCWL